MTDIPHVHLWPKEAVSNEEAIESSERASSDPSPQGPTGHVGSTCETETEMQPEDGIPVGHLSHEDSPESITYT